MKAAWGWVVAAAAFAPAAARADLMGDARAMFDRLGNLGDFGRSAADQGVREARALAEGWWPALDPLFRQRWTEAQAALAEARRLSGLPPRRPVLVQPNWNEFDARFAALGTALNAVGAARSAYIATANARAGDAVNAVINDLRKRADTAIGALRSLLPTPVGTRPVTRNARCRAPVTNIEFDCVVPNDPPGDNDIRAAIAAGNSALADLGRASAIARIEYERRLQAEFNTMLERCSQAMTELSNLMKAIHETQMRIIQNLR